MITRESMRRLYLAAGEALHSLMRIGEDAWIDVDRFEVRAAADLDDDLKHSRDVVLAVAVGPGKVVARLAPEEATALMFDLAHALEQGRRAAHGRKGSDKAA